MWRFALLAVLASLALAEQAADRWIALKSPHFEVDSQGSDEAARTALVSFERLRTFFEQSHLPGIAFNERSGHIVRVVVFRSEKDYEEYRIRTIADAYYVSDGNADTIIMAAAPEKAFSIAAHEYAHYVFHAAGLKLPACLNEGLAEYFSTLRFSDGAYELGGDLPGRTKVLRGRTWLTPAELFDWANESSVPDARQLADIFYAESWALSDMLVTSPPYAERFRELISEFSGGSNAGQAFRKVYGKSLGQVAAELRNWVAMPRIGRFALREPVGFRAAQGHEKIHELSSFETRSLMAQLSFVSGHVDTARIRYEELLREKPNDPEISTALGTIAGRQGKREDNLRYWREAISDNSTDAGLCYRYALLAEEAGAEPQEVRAGLEKALALAPDFDDARYKLALIESQAGEYRRAVEQLRAMRVPVETRRFAYWVAMASALTEEDERDEAKEAAQEALKSAKTEDEKSQAKQMAYIAATDLTVQFMTDSEGHSRMATTRVPHGTTDWNPFIEPNDNLQRTKGELGEVFCKAGKLSGFLVRTADGPLTVEVPDPLHVLIRDGPQEFYCGPMRGKEVEADYAVFQAPGKTTNVLRGMTFQ